jgi:outer membrane protein TolC
MNGVSPSSFPRGPTVRAFLARPGLLRCVLPACVAALSWLALGCGPQTTALTRAFSLEKPEPVTVARGAAPETLGDRPLPPSPALTLGEPETLSSPRPVQRGTTLASPDDVEWHGVSGERRTFTTTPTPAAPAVLPLSLETIFRLAEEQNSQVKLAREQVSGACADLDLANLSWLPRVYAGPAYYRHEGGIQDQNGQLIHSSTGALFAGLEINAQFDIRDATFQRVRAERELWQQKGELTRITHTTLLAASSAYMDLLAARTGEAVLRSLDTRLQALLRQAENLGETVAQAPVELIRAEVHNNQMILLKLRQLAEATSAQLAYHLGVPPGTQFEPVDPTLAPFALVDASPPLEALLAQAMQNGPGVREIEGMLDMLHSNVTMLNGPAQMLPVFELRMAEGAFGAGPGASLAWDNRWDVGLQARWNLGGLVTSKQQQRAAESRLVQAHLALQDLRAKLSSGVQEARETVHSTGSQISQGQQQIEHAEKSYHLLAAALKTAPQKDRLLVDVMRALLAIKQAQQDYLLAINGYDKAQLRLLLLLGPVKH